MTACGVFGCSSKGYIGNQGWFLRMSTIGKSCVVPTIMYVYVCSYVCGYIMFKMKSDIWMADQPYIPHPYIFVNFFNIQRTKGGVCVELLFT